MNNSFENEQNKLYFERLKKNLMRRLQTMNKRNEKKIKGAHLASSLIEML